MTSLRHGLSRAAAAAADNAIALGYAAGWRALRWLPERAAYAGFDRIADEVFRRNGRGVRRLRDNLATATRAVDQEYLETLNRDAVRSYLRYTCEAFRLPSWGPEGLVARTRTVGEEEFRALYAAGSGLIVPLPHMGNWDWAGAWACATGMPVMTVAERLKPERLYDEFVAYRTTLGMQILPLTGGEATVPRLEGWLREGGLVCLLADRDLSRTSVEVELCGARARLPRGPATLARHTGAPIAPVTLHYDGPRMVITFHPTVAVDDDAATMQRVADVFTEAITAHPIDWHMMQRVFV